MRAVVILILAFVWLAKAGTNEDFARTIAPLVDPAKLATLKERGANPRVQKYVAQLGEAKIAGHDVERIAERAVALAGMKGEAARLTAAAMVRNVTIAERLGCLDAAGLRDMRKGQSPTIQRGPYKGQELSVDHILPVSIAPELGNVMANLELLPLRLNQAKGNEIDQRGLDTNVDWTLPRSCGRPGCSVNRDCAP